MAKKGRKTKLNKSVLKKIQSRKGEGLTDKEIARFIKVHPDTFINWKKKGD